MRRFACLIGVIAAVGLIASLQAQPPRPPAASRPAASAAAADLKRIEALLSGPQPKTLDEYADLLKRQAPQVLSVLDEMERKYPGTPELNQARVIAMTAAVQLSRATDDPAMVARVKGIARNVLASNASAEDKLFADAHLLLLHVRPPDSSSSQPAPDSAKAIMDFTRRYAGLSEGAKALEVGLDLADMIGDQDLAKSLLEQLVRDYPRHPLTRMVLRRRGQSPDVGKPFKATLTRLDGSKLKLSDDLLGKVVVVDFWASWCGPCVQAIPEMTRLYAAYKPKGVEFVGVSLDNDRGRLEQFVRSSGMTWIITYSGMAWEDPTARQYGVSAIPNVWVIGKDGKVVSDDAGGRLAELLDQVLAGAAAAPATKTTPKTTPPRQGR